MIECTESKRKFKDTTLTGVYKLTDKLWWHERSYQ